MVVVSDTSPISNLALIDRLDLLRIQFDRVAIPDAVKSNATAFQIGMQWLRFEQAVQEGWLGCRNAGNIQSVDALATQLDRGEAEAPIVHCASGVNIQ